MNMYELTRYQYNNVNYDRAAMTEAQFKAAYPNESYWQVIPVEPTDNGPE